MIPRIALAALLVFALIFASGCLQGFRSTNPELCNKVEQQQNKDACYRNVAWAKNDSAFCTKISDLNMRDGCYAYLASGRSWGLMTD